MSKPAVVNCPRCGTPVEWTEKSPYRPFCSERCKLMDLGAWATEKYKVPDESDNAEDDPGGEPSPERGRD
jgi:endogenous inhibitor of DNA gyrase (YacG/DUF329 family)